MKLSSNKSLLFKILYDKFIYKLNLDDQYIFSSFLIVMLTFIITINITNTITYIPLINHIPHFEIIVSNEWLPEIAYGLVYDDLILSVTPEPVIISGNNNLPPINNSNTFFTKGLLSTVLTRDPSYLAKNISELSPDQQQHQQDNLSKTQNQTIQINNIYQYPKLISGTWALNVSRGLVTDFQANFKMVNINGMDKHFLEILNFRNNDGPYIELDQLSSTTINGFADIKIDNQLLREKSPLTIEISKINTIELTMLDKLLVDLFYNDSLLGIMDSFRNFENDELLAYEEYS